VNDKIRAIFFLSRPQIINDFGKILGKKTRKVKILSSFFFPKLNSGRKEEIEKLSAKV